MYNKRHEVTRRLGHRDFWMVVIEKNKLQQYDVFKVTLVLCCGLLQELHRDTVVNYYNVFIWSSLLCLFPLFSVYVDVNIWLVTFGFHLHNAIPGFPIPKFDLTQPSLEMKKSQLWDDLPVCI